MNKIERKFCTSLTPSGENMTILVTFFTPDYDSRTIKPISISLHHTHVAIPHFSLNLLKFNLYFYFLLSPTNYQKPS